MRQRLNLFFLFLLICSCNNVAKNDCSYDNDFKNQFFNCIKIVESTIEKPNNTFGEDEFMEHYEVMQAVRCLEALTGQFNHMSFEEVGYAVYETENHMLKDTKVWLEWYNANKCRYTIDSAEAQFKRIRKPFPDYTSKRVIDSLRIVWNLDFQDSLVVRDSLFHVSTDVYWPKMHIKL